MDIEELRIKGKELGIKQAMNMKKGTLIARIADIEYLDKIPEKVMQGMEIDLESTKLISPTIQIDISEPDQKFFKTIGLEVEWLSSLANQYKFTRFHYVHKFRAFRCYRDGRHLDWIDLNDLGLLYAKKQLTDIKMKYQPLQKDKKIIKLPWSR